MYILLLILSFFAYAEDVTNPEEGTQVEQEDMPASKPKHHHKKVQKHAKVVHVQREDPCLTITKEFHCAALAREDAVSLYVDFNSELEKHKECVERLTPCKHDYDKWYAISNADDAIKRLETECSVDVSALNADGISKLAQKRNGFISERENIADTYAKYEIDPANVEGYGVLEKCTRMYGIVETKIDEITARESSAKLFKRYDAIAKAQGLSGIYVSSVGASGIYGGGIELAIFDLNAENVSPGLIKQYALYEGDAVSNWAFLEMKDGMVFYKNQSNVLIAIEGGKDGDALLYSDLFILKDLVAFKNAQFKVKKVPLFKVLKTN